MARIQNVVPHLWFENDADAAVAFYTSIFPRSRVLRTAKYTEEGRDIHGRPAGSTMTIEFEIDGFRMTALNGGPAFKFNEAISLQVLCETQEEVDRYWKALSEGGDPTAQQCGWLKDRFGLSWQIVPERLAELVADPDSVKASRVMKEMFKMKKLDVATLERAYGG